MKTYRVRERQHAELVPDLLLARGVTETEHFLRPDFERDSHDPYLLPDMDKAVERILRAHKNNERVCVWSDYDCDGVPGGVLLTEFLRVMGLDVTHYIPHRHEEGYGLNTPGLEKLASEKITLTITVDLGITDKGPVAFANEKGMDVIITDHHLVPSEMPDAVAVVDPKRADSQYPFDGLCGAGVAWKLVQAILQKLRSSGRPFDYAQGREKWLLDLVGIATVSDMVPLVGENRMLAHFGLRVLRRNRRPGLAALLSLLRIKSAGVTEDDIGFMIAPRINAASRMDSPELAARLLSASDMTEAAAIAKQLNLINDQRKGLVASVTKEVNKRLAESEMIKSPIIVMGNPNWRPGILGLVANSLAEAHGKSVFLWGREGGDMIRGSCRAGGSTNIVEVMRGAADVFDDFGGHTAAGGFSVTQEKVHELLPRLTQSYETLVPGLTAQEVVVDRELDIAEVSRAYRDLSQMAPFGIGNEKPLFLMPRVSVARTRTFGKTNNHVELEFMRGSDSVTGVAFFSGNNSFSRAVSQGVCGDLVCHIESDWRGRPRARIIDFL